jgi:uncharacterized protein (TIGR00375 family)
MRVITDFHLHSKYSRACSQQLTLPNIAKACERKGIQLVGTSDAFHPAWRKDIGEQLVETAAGIFELKDGSSVTKFFLSTEISCIYKKGDKVRRVHHLLMFPSITALDRMIASLEARGCNLKSDGRPIVGLPSEELIRLALDADPQTLFIPAHAWTPWFSVFGSKSGFNSLEECFGDYAKYVYAIETGLSSDPAMNWRLSQLDSLFLISNSDAHSLENLGREANVFEMESPAFPELQRIFQEHDTAKFLETIEFFPEEGKYHADGHATCGFWCSPQESKRLKFLCPKCGKPLVIGVEARVEELADRPPHPTRPARAVPFRSIIPLAELVADALESGKTSKKVKQILDQLSTTRMTEFQILLDATQADLERVAPPEIVSSILKMRAGEVEIRPGYDGIYGEIKVKGVSKKEQGTLLF